MHLMETVYGLQNLLVLCFSNNIMIDKQTTTLRLQFLFI